MTGNIFDIFDTPEGDALTDGFFGECKRLTNGHGSGLKNLIVIATLETPAKGTLGVTATGLGCACLGCKAFLRVALQDFIEDKLSASDDADTPQVH